MNTSDFSVVDVPDREMSLIRADELGRAAQRVLDRRASLQGGIPSTVTFIPRSPEAQAAWRRRKPAEPGPRATAYAKRPRTPAPIPDRAAVASPAIAPDIGPDPVSISPAADHDAQVKSRAVEGHQEDLVPGTRPNKPLMRKGCRFPDDAGKSARTSGITFTQTANNQEDPVQDHVDATIRELRTKRDAIDALIRDLETMFGTTLPARSPKQMPASPKPRRNSAPQAGARPPGNGVTAAVRSAIAAFSGEFSNKEIAEMVRKDGPNPIWKAKG